MTDLCKNCIFREDMNMCYKKPCDIHESWYVKRLEEEAERDVLAIAIWKERALDTGWRPTIKKELS